MDRRQVDDVEPQLGQLGQALEHAGQTTPGAGKQLIPRSEPRGQAVDLDGQRGFERHPVMALLAPLGGLEQLRAQGDVVLGRLRQLWVVQAPQRVLDQGPILRRRGALHRRLEQQPAFGELSLEVFLARFQLPPELVAPGPERVDPGLDRVLVAAQAEDVEAALPAHAVQMCVHPMHLRLVPLALVWAPPAHHHPELVVPVAEHVGGDHDRVTDAPLSWVTAAVDRRGRVLNHDARRCPLPPLRFPPSGAGRLRSGPRRCHLS